MTLSFILFGLGLVCLVLFIVSRDKKGSANAVCFKTGTSVFFVATAISAIIYQASTFTVPVELLLPMLLLTFGLVMGLIGDITLDFKIYLASRAKDEEMKKDVDKMMWIGMISFAIGHIMYISALRILYPTIEFKYLLIACGIGLLLISLVFLTATKLLKMNFKKFFIPCFVYGFLLSTFVAYSLIVMISSKSMTTILLLVGSILFIVSDLILSMTYFSKEEDYKKEGIMNPESRFMISLNHITYYLAQFAIALAILFL